MTREALERRARDIRARAAVRAWDYRQLHHAKGSWYRLRRLLADAREAWAISAEEAAALIAAGVHPEPVGHELEPPKLILVVDNERLASVASKRRLELHLDAAMLEASHLVLVRFP